MFLLPYETTVCKTLYNPTSGGKVYPKQYVDQIENAIKKANIYLPIPPVDARNGEVLDYSGQITPVDDYEDINKFTQIVNIGDHKEPKLVVDARLYKKIEQRTGIPRILQQNEWQFQYIRMALNIKLLREGPDFLHRLGDIPVKVFYNWISGILTQKYNLPPESTQAIWVICAVYYFAMQDDELMEPGQERDRLIPIISRLTYIPAGFITDVIDTLGSLRGAGDLAYEISTNGRSIRMGKLKFSDLQLLVSPSWFGTASRENVGVALEHMPTYITLIYMALADRSYRKTVLSQKVEMVSRSDDASRFINLVNEAVSSQFVK